MSRPRSRQTSAPSLPEILETLKAALRSGDHAQIISAFETALEPAVRQRHRAGVQVVLEEIAGHPALSERWQRRLADERDWTLRSVLAARPDVTPAVIAILGDQLDALARNPAISSGLDARIDERRGLIEQARSSQEAALVGALRDHQIGAVRQVARMNAAGIAQWEARLAALGDDELKVSELIRASATPGMSSAALGRWLERIARTRKEGKALTPTTLSDLERLRHVAIGEAAAQLERWIARQRVLHHELPAVTVVSQQTAAEDGATAQQVDVASGALSKPKRQGRENRPPAGVKVLDWLGWGAQQRSHLPSWARSERVRKALEGIPERERIRAVTPGEISEISVLTAQLEAVYRFALREAKPETVLQTITRLDNTALKQIKRAAAAYVAARCGV